MANMRSKGVLIIVPYLKAQRVTDSWHKCCNTVARVLHSSLNGSPVMSSNEIGEVPHTGRILIPAVMILGLLITIGVTAFLGYGIVALLHL